MRPAIIHSNTTEGQEVQTDQGDNPMDNISIIEKETVLTQKLEELEQREEVMDKLVADKEATMVEFEKKLAEVTELAKKAEEHRLNNVKELEAKLSQMNSSILAKQELLDGKGQVIIELKEQIEAVEVMMNPEKAQEIAQERLEAQAKAERTEFLADAEVELNGLRLDIEDLIAGLEMYQQNKDFAKEGDLDHFVSEFKGYGQEVNDIVEDILDVPPSDDKREYREEVQEVVNNDYPELSNTISGLFRAVGKCFAILKSEQEEAYGLEKGHRPAKRTKREQLGQLGQALKNALVT